jgi:serine phosphatase RsbU (regulator of sigma subunit)
MINKPRLIYHAAGWLLTFYFIIISIEINQLKWMHVWIVFHIFFWYQLNKSLVAYFKPPIDLLLVLTISLASLQNNILSHILAAMPDNYTLGFFPTLLLSWQILIFCLILVINSSLGRGFEERIGDSNTNYSINTLKQGSLVFYAIVGFIAYHLVLFEHAYILYIFQFFLLLTLLNKTSWLERLSKSELLILFWIFAFLFYFYSDPSGMRTISFIEADQKLSWFGLPVYVHFLVKMYLLAATIKIPVVLIYNHATLSRKMWIAGLFQSTFPQLIQFVFLLFIFFSLLSSWQAENLREALERQVNLIKKGKISKELTYTKIPLKSEVSSVYLQDYQPLKFFATYHTHGVLALQKSHKRAKREFNKEDYFYFVKSDKSEPQSIYLVKIDTAFISLLTRDVTFLSGTGLIFYPFTPKEWQRFIFDLPILDKDRDMRIYPFGIFSLNESWSLISRRGEADSTDIEARVFSNEDIFGNQKVILGRVYVPVSNTVLLSQPYFAFDIFLNVESAFTPSATGKIIWILLLVFLLFNSLVIRQVGKFGTQINKIILQKFSQLKKGIQEIAQGNLDYKFKMEGEDEFVELAGHFNEMSIKLKHTIAEAREKDRLNHELKIARQVQMSLLPSKLPSITGYEIAASMKTANEIGGDFYDIMAIDKDTYLFTIGDVSGKGSSAAFYMAQFISLLRYSCQFTAKPEEIAIRMNKYFSTHIVDRQIFITAIIGILNLSSHQIKIVRAGHTLPVLIPGDITKDIHEVKLEGLGLGLTKTERTFKKKIDVHTIDLLPGDKVVFYTDGVVEAARPPAPESHISDMEVYGEMRFMNLLIDSRELPVEDLSAVCTYDLNHFYGENPRVDDHTLFFLQRNS